MKKKETKKKVVKTKKKTSKAVVEKTKKLSAKELEDQATKLLEEADEKKISESKEDAKASKYYFGDVEQEAFLKFIKSKEKSERDALYNQHLKKPFQIMVESILRRYPIHIGNYGMKEVEEYALAHLIEYMGKFDENRTNKLGKKTKAFSYCQTIVRNFFIDWGKRSYAEKTMNLNYDDFSSEIENMDEYSYEIDKSQEIEMNELMIVVVDKLKDRLQTDKSLRKNEIVVGEAIVNVLENWDILFLEETRYGKYNKRVTNNYTKNKIILLLKEQTRLSTKDIRASMKQFKDLYFFNKRLFFNDSEE